jgi:serine/threonine protein kinase
MEKQELVALKILKKMKHAWWSRFLKHSYSYLATEGYNNFLVEEVKVTKQLFQLQVSLVMHNSVHHQYLVINYTVFKSPLFLELKGVYEVGRRSILALPFCEEGDMYSKMRSSPLGRLTEQQVKKAYRNVVKSLAIMHELGYAHRDLKVSKLHSTPRVCNNNWD